MRKKLGWPAREEAADPDMPAGFAYLWGIFHQVCSSVALTYAELTAWQKLSRWRLLPWEAEVLVMLDRILRSVQHAS